MYKEPKKKLLTMYFYCLSYYYCHCDMLFLSLDYFLWDKKKKKGFLFFPMKILSAFILYKSKKSEMSREILSINWLSNRNCLAKCMWPMAWCTLPWWPTFQKIHNSPILLIWLFILKLLSCSLLLISIDDIYKLSSIFGHLIEEGYDFNQNLNSCQIVLWTAVWCRERVRKFKHGWNWNKICFYSC